MTQGFWNEKTIPDSQFLRQDEFQRYSGWNEQHVEGSTYVTRAFGHDLPRKYYTFSTFYAHLLINSMKQGSFFVVGADKV